MPDVLSYTATVSRTRLMGARLIWPNANEVQDPYYSSCMTVSPQPMNGTHADLK
ncbi:hypothetical protein EWB00_003430, partial [Schistosoma japonicum]